MKVGTQIFDAIFQKIHNEGYKFIAISILVSFILLLISKFFKLSLIFFSSFSISSAVIIGLVERSDSISLEIASS